MNSLSKIATGEEKTIDSVEQMYKYNDTVTFLVMEDSSLVMMNISYMKYDCPKKLETCTSGE